MSLNNRKAGGVIFDMDFDIQISLDFSIFSSSLVCGGVSLPIDPHVTIFMTENCDKDSAIEIFRNFHKNWSINRLNIAGLVLFSDVLCLAVTPTVALLQAHGELVTHFESRRVPASDYYRTGSWIPHITIRRGVGDSMLSSARAAFSDMLPVSVGVKDLRLLTVSSQTTHVISPVFKEEITR